MGDFNVNPDKPRPTETKYKRQIEIINFLKYQLFFDIFESTHNITVDEPFDTWFNNSKGISSRIDFIWMCSTAINHLIYCEQTFCELYTSDHKMLIAYLDKAAIFGQPSNAHLRSHRITKTKYLYDKMNTDKWTSFSTACDAQIRKVHTINKYTASYVFRRQDLNNL